jgi:hypothetical protein
MISFPRMIILSRFNMTELSHSMLHHWDFFLSDGVRKMLAFCCISLAFMGNMNGKFEKMNRHRWKQSPSLVTF